MREKKELTFDFDVAADAAIVWCRRRLTLTCADELRGRSQPLVAGRRTVTLDLTDVTLIDSVGLVTRVLSLFEAAGEANIRLP